MGKGLSACRKGEGYFGVIPALFTLNNNLTAFHTPCPAGDRVFTPPGPWHHGVRHVAPPRGLLTPLSSPSAHQGASLPALKSFPSPPVQPQGSFAHSWACSVFPL